MKYRRISQYRRISKKEMEKVHVYIPEVYEQLKQGRISRREFMRTATLLGMSAGVATIAAACGTGGTTVQEPVAEEPVAEEPAAEEPVVEEEAATGGIVRGGTLREGSQVKAVDHPARYSWAFDADQTRHVYEYLVETDGENISHPFLLESWVPNDDLTVWDLIVREGVNWTNGDPLTAEDIKWNFEEWLNLDTGSSILALWEGFLTSSGIEVVDERTLRLNLTAPLLAVPENLFHYPAQIIHPSFDGDITSGNTPSTGAHIIDEYIVGERVRTVARWSRGDEGYWRMGADGRPLTYIEAFEWIDLGEDSTAYVSALQSGQLDVYAPAGASAYLALRDNENLQIASIGTSQTQTLRFRVDLDPWGDMRLRNAVKMVQDREKILDNAYFGEGDLGYDVHVAPVHPEWSPMDLPAYDPEGARALLDEAGVETLDFSISVGSGWDYIVSYAETLAEDARAAGINITLDTMPISAYWDLWTETPVGITTWTHRPLAVMLLPLAYIADSEGNPVAWNESRWVDEEFSAILKEAQGTLDLEARRALTAELQRIQLERGSVAISFYRDVWTAHNPGYQGILAHPTGYRLYHEVWFDPEMAS